MANRLRELRVSKQAAAEHPREWSQRSVAMKVRTDQGTYWRWEQGATPEEYFQVRLAELFGVERSELGFDR